MTFHNVYGTLINLQIVYTHTFIYVNKITDYQHQDKDNY